MKTDFNNLVHKIDAFRKRYHLYHFLRGLILFFLVVILLFFSINIIEYQLYMSTEWRRILFVSSMLFIAVIFLRYVFFTGLLAFGIIKVLNNRKASQLIHSYIPELKDRLVNILELHDNNDLNASDEITQAAIAQKIDEIRFIDFRSAVSLKQLRNIFFYFIGSFLLVFAVHLFNKNIYTESANRIIHFNQQFVRPAPYEFVWTNETDGVKKGDNFTVLLNLQGEELPSMVYINIGGNNYLMDAQEPGKFEYQLNALVNPVNFYFTDLKYKSISFGLNIIPVPVINAFDILVDVPDYTGLSNSKTSNIGDLQIPKGSRVEWIFNCFDTDSLILIIDQEEPLIGEKGNGNAFQVSRTFMKPSVYEVKVKNNQGEFESAMRFRVDLIEDLYPEINIVQVQDSFQLTRFYFRGTIHDDYGFSNLAFHLNIEMEDTFLTLPFNRYVMPQEFYYQVDLLDYKYENKALDYYFSVTDNDAVNGPKTTTSESFSFIFPEKSEIEEIQKEEYNKIEELITESQRLTNEIKEDIKDLQFKNLNSNISDWEKSQLVQELVNKKNNLESILEKIENSYKDLSNFQNTFTEQGSEILEKQEMIQELLDDVFTDELKKLMEEFNELAREFNEKRMNELSQQMEMTFDDLSKQLDRNLQMLQKMKLEQELQNIIEDVVLMQEKQQNQAIEINEEGNFEQMSEELINDHLRMEEIQQDLLEILENNQQLEKPLLFDNFSQEFTDIKENMRNTLEELQKENKRNSSRSMQNSSEMLKNMAFAMQQMLNANTMQQNMENIRDLQQILKNLLVMSFGQEEILTGIGSAAGGDPDINRLTRKQRDLIRQSEVVKDSLYALAKRAPQIDNVVNNELLALNINLIRSSELLNEGLRSQAVTNQQLVLTAANNLALLLSDILKQIEEQMNNPQEGEGEGEGPQGKKMGGLKQQSDNLKDQLQKMLDQMKNGNQPMSKDMSESLMMHEMMQQMLREMMNSGSLGESTRKQLQEIDQILEQNRRELMNKRVNPQLMRRHNEIMTRLLEAERSERERDQDNKRESNTADEQFYSRPAEFFEFKQDQKNSIEFLEKGNVKLNNFYLDKFKNYMEKFNKVNP